MVPCPRPPALQQGRGKNRIYFILFIFLSPNSFRIHGGESTERENEINWPNFQEKLCMMFD